MKLASFTAHEQSCEPVARPCPGPVIVLNWQSLEIELPNAIRIYKPFLGGKGHYAADREEAKRLLSRGSSASSPTWRATALRRGRSSRHLGLGCA